ncbi:MAG TPA: hydrogenase subunit MbhD domain-containing protein [Gaiellaceae bacterium]|nr:hydrogenase subunit MbhD domain-containing protein [Gaiellaceae bacterium]
MIPLQLAALLMVGLVATTVVLVRDPLRMTIINVVYGLTLTILFLVFQAPDVALSMLVVGGIAYPVVLLAAIAKVRSGDDE